DEPDGSPVGRVAAAELVPELLAEPGERPVASNLGHDGPGAHDGIVSVGVVTSNHTRSSAREARDPQAEPALVRVAGIDDRDVRRELADQPGERLGLEVVETSS